MTGRGKRNANAITWKGDGDVSLKKKSTRTAVNNEATMLVNDNVSSANVNVSSMSTNLLAAIHSSYNAFTGAIWSLFHVATVNAFDDTFTLPLPPRHAAAAAVEPQILACMIVKSIFYFSFYDTCHEQSVDA
jgi:hypothetical protein